jgi:hypothetical protein
MANSRFGVRAIHCCFPFAAEPLFSFVHQLAIFEKTRQFCTASDYGPRTTDHGPTLRLPRTSKAASGLFNGGHISPVFFQRLPTKLEGCHVTPAIHPLLRDSPLVCGGESTIHPKALNRHLVTA